MFPAQNPAFPKGPSRLFSDFSDFDSPPKNPSFPTCPSRLLGGFKGLSRINMSSAVVFYHFLGGF